MSAPKRSSVRARTAVRLGVLLVVTFLAGTAPHSAHGSPRGYDARPVPSWVLRAEPEAATTAGDDRARGGMIDELVDDQYRLGVTVEHYAHRVRRVVSSAGLENAGELEVEVDPSSEQLAIHGIHVVRGGTRIDVLGSSAPHAVQEDSGDERTYSDRVREVFVVPDLRVGDVVDLEYTIVGQNSVFDGHFVRTASLVAGLFAERLRVRLLVPAARARALATQVAGIALSPTERDVGADHELVWDRHQVSALEFEEGAPAWFEAHPVIRWSEFASWADVAQWGMTLFDRPEQAADEQISARAKEIQKAHQAPAEQTLAALDFVQNEVRYLGIEPGEHSHLPHPPADILAQRFGDCKDKSLLLVRILGVLGIDARVALVNPELGAHVADRLPSPLVFNHAIVRVRIDGKTYFIDPTRSYQAGPLEIRSALDYGRALVLAPGTADLENIPERKPNGPTIESRSVYGIGKGAAEATLTVATTYRGDEADGERRALAEVSRAEVQKRYLNFYSGDEPSIQVAGELEIQDDTATDELEVREKYVIPDYWKTGEAHIDAESVRHRLKKPSTVRRTSPLAIPYPVFVRDTIELHMRHGPAPRFESRKLQDRAMTYEQSGHAEGAVLFVTYELRTRQAVLPLEAVPAHLDLIGSIHETLGATIPDGTPRKADVPWTPGERRALYVGLGIVGLITGVFFARRLRFVIRRRRYRRGAQLGAGESAARATSVEGQAAAERILGREKCGCGTPLGSDTSTRAWSAIRLAEQTVQVVRATCATCGRASARYFRFET